MIVFEDISIRLMQDSLEDYNTMATWLSNPNVLEYYEGRDNPFDFEKVVEKYQPRVLMQSNVFPCLFQYNETVIGYIQYYEIMQEEKAKYGYPERECLFGIDLFIGETKYWNKGIGSKVLSALLQFLINDKSADRIIIDPQTWNTRAVKCYEKCGFVKVKLLPKNELHEGTYRDCWLMEKKAIR